MLTRDSKTPAETVLTDPTTGLPQGVRPRLDAIDLLRGLVMVLMALDHTRDYLTDLRLIPTDLTKSSTALFLTRWVTHFCAPVFVFLAGTGAFLYRARGKTRPQLAWFLFSRGVWLVVLEFTVINVGWSFCLASPPFLAQVIWAIGCSMVLLAALVYLPPWLIGAAGVLLVAGHNCLDALPTDSVPPSPWVTLLLRPGPVQLGEGVSVIVAYPVLPWFGVLAAGYGLGPVWLLDRPRRRRRLVVLGVALTLLFLLLRGLNRYGDPNPWSPQANGWFTVLSFLNCTKYPPSLLFVLMTLGPGLLALAWFDRTRGPLGRRLVTFGRVPFFFYLLHIPLIHGLAVVLALARYGQASFFFYPIILDPGPLPEGYGYDLGVVYLAWLGVVAALYPACRWFAEVKRRRRDVWLSYL
jgi:uncharacterized membrane protein